MAAVLAVAIVAALNAQALGAWLGADAGRLVIVVVLAAVAVASPPGSPLAALPGCARSPSAWGAGSSRSAGLFSQPSADQAQQGIDHERAEETEAQESRNRIGTKKLQHDRMLSNCNARFCPVQDSTWHSPCSFKRQLRSVAALAGRQISHRLRRGLLVPARHVHPAKVGLYDGSRRTLRQDLTFP